MLACTSAGQETRRPKPHWLLKVRVAYSREACLLDRFKEEIFYTEGGDPLAQVAQRGGGYPTPGNIQDQVGRGSEQPVVVEDVLAAPCQRVGLDDL